MTTVLKEARAKINVDRCYKELEKAKDNTDKAIEDAEAAVAPSQDSDYTQQAINDRFYDVINNDESSEMDSADDEYLFGPSGDDDPGDSSAGIRRKAAPGASRAAGSSASGSAKKKPRKSKESSKEPKEAKEDDSGPTPNVSYSYILLLKNIINKVFIFIVMLSLCFNHVMLWLSY